MWFISLDDKICLSYRADLFKFGHLIYGLKWNATCLYSSLEGTEGESLVRIEWAGIFAISPCQN
jgi:hypothetical protein